MGRTSKRKAFELQPSGRTALGEAIFDTTKGESTAKTEPTESKSNISQKPTELSKEIPSRVSQNTDRQFSKERLLSPISQRSDKKSPKERTLALFSNEVPSAQNVTDNPKGHVNKRNSEVREPFQKKKTELTMQDIAISFQTDVVNNEPQEFSNTEYSDEKFYYKKYTGCKAEKNSNLGDTIVELEGDLFESDERYSLAHCVAEDMSMGSGIAVEFKNKFKKVGYLLDQQIKTGGVAVLKKDERFIYYLVTKPRSTGKPTIKTLEKSLKAMKNHALEHAVKEIAMPTIGCGLDRLDWEDVRALIQDIFESVDITIFVYHLSGNNPTMDKPKSGYIEHMSKELVNVGKNTARFYIGNTSDEITPEMVTLDECDKFIKEYLKSKRSIGDVIEIKGYYDITFGFICKDNNVISYEAVERCLTTFKKMNKKHDYGYVGIQAFKLHNDSLVMAKLENVLKNCLVGYTICICWPEGLTDVMPTPPKFTV